MSSSDLATKRIGENLLRGWTLLGENCPGGCTVPLMRSRDKKQLVCCGCEVDFLNQEVSRATLVPEVVVSQANQAHSSVSTGVKAGVDRSELSSVLDGKLAWLSKQIEISTSVVDLAQMVELASKLLELRRTL